MAFLTKILGDSNERVIKGMQPLVDKINNLEGEFEKFSDAQFKEKTKEFKERLEKGETLDYILPEAFALVRESAKRTLNQRHFDVQLIGGIVLHQGSVAEMKTGEGKTLAATLSLYLNALEGKGAHLVTVNDYLARRDTVWMGQIYHMLGLSTGCIVHDNAYIYDPEYQGDKPEIRNPTFESRASGRGKSETNPNDQNSKFQNGKRDEERDTTGGFMVEESYLRPASRKEAYKADITYGTNNEFGFDYLRDNMVYNTDQMVQSRSKEASLASQSEAGDFHYAIVDEVDSILIDEARTPLIISAPDTDATKMYQEFARITPTLKENVHYNIDEKMRAATLTDEGINKVENILGVGNIYEERGVRVVHHLEQALRAQVLFKRDRDYVVKDGEVIIVDEFTGRLMPGRRYSEGLHQALEAKEGVRVQQESRTLATITFQNYFRMYKKLSGMTGTAATNAEEFHKVYNIDVVIVPTNKPMVRRDLADKIYKTGEGKFMALVKEIKEKYERGQPVLVGTVSIEKNEYLGTLLKKEGIPHQILNAKHHEKEAQIIAQAGKLGQVTIATNMAGRGVDIILGGNPPNPKESEVVKKLGGLHVIGTERHEARRIDNQLRGRSGRQGDPGSSQFFLSLEDDIMRIFGGDRIKNLMTTLGIPEDQSIENKLVSNAIESAQSKIEGYNFDTRKHVLEYDDVMNVQRATIYRRRKEIIQTKENKKQVMQMIEDEIKKIVEFHAQGEHTEKWNIKEISEIINSVFSETEDLRSNLKEFKEKEDLINYLTKLSKEKYEAKEKEIGEENMRQAEKFILLRTVDMLWMDHLDFMEHLRDSVRLRAYGQKDPLVEYKNEGHKMFKRLIDSIQSNIVGNIFKVGLVRNQHQSSEEARFHGSQKTQQELEVERRGVQKPGQPKSNKVGRNDPCPCGAINPATGKVYKYKRCGMVNASHHKK